MDRSFVIADIPGLIEGAADGAGLGVQFLRHLNRTRILLHLIDMASITDSDPVHDVKAIARELKKFSPELSERERWLVLNKLDLLDTDERARRQKDLVKRLRWRGPVYAVSAATGEGCTGLMQDLMTRLETLKQGETHDRAD